MIGVKLKNSLPSCPFLATQIQLVSEALTSHLDLPWIISKRSQFTSPLTQKEAWEEESAGDAFQPNYFFPLYFLLTGLTQAWEIHICS